MKRIILLVTLLVIISTPSISKAQFESFRVKPIQESDFYTFIKIFSEMRGPLRQQILKDSKASFEKADPLEYISKVKNENDVQKVLKDNNVNWDQFVGLLSNVLLGYFSTQPDKTKTALVKQLSTYGLKMADTEIPAEYRSIIDNLLKTSDGAAIANMVIDQVLQIPPENIELAKKHKRQLDQLFYTKFWKDKI